MFHWFSFRLRFSFGFRAKGLRSGQIQPISIVIMTGIVIGLVGVAYFWGVPLIQKRSSMSEFSNMERFISDLEQAIVELARSGTGQKTIDMNNAYVTLLPYDSGNGNNSLIIEYDLEQPLMFPNTSIYLGAAGFGDINSTGVYGESSPSIVMLRVTKSGNLFDVMTKIIYRELLRQEPPKRGYLIALCPKRNENCDTTIRGSKRITLSFDKNINRPGMAANGGDLVLTYIDVELA